MQDSKSKKTQTIKEYWTEHRLTLIAYEAQYVYAKQPNQFHESRKEELDPKKKTNRKKVNLQYQSAFLSISPQESKDFKVSDLVKNYDGLNSLFNNQGDENALSVCQFIKILLELKHSAIVNQFCQIYNVIVKELNQVEFTQIEKQDSRFMLLQKVKQAILTRILNNKQMFPYFTSYLIKDQLETKKLLLVEAYCILAEKFNFNINQFYSEAFSVSFDSNPSKRVKKA